MLVLAATVYEIRIKKKRTYGGEENGAIVLKSSLYISRVLKPFVFKKLRRIVLDRHVIERDQCFYTPRQSPLASPVERVWSSYDNARDFGDNK